MVAAHRSASMAALDRNVKTVWPGVIVGWIGDAAHRDSPSDHNPDDTPGSRPGQTDADSDPEVRALDVMIGPAFSEEDGWRLVDMLVNDSRSQRRLHYVIYQRRVWSRTSGWAARTYTGSDPHTGHTHISGWVGDDANDDDWPAVLEIGDHMDQGEFQQHMDQYANRTAGGDAGTSPSQRAARDDWRNTMDTTGIKNRLDALTPRVQAIEDGLTTIEAKIDTLIAAHPTDAA